MIKLTKKETKFIKKVLNYLKTTLEQLKGDNYSWFQFEDVKKDYSKNEFAGLISSLSQKGMVVIDEEVMTDNGSFESIYCLSETLIDN